MIEQLTAFWQRNAVTVYGVLLTGIGMAYFALIIREMRRRK